MLRAQACKPKPKPGQQHEVGRAEGGGGNGRGGGGERRGEVPHGGEVGLEVPGREGEGGALSSARLWPICVSTGGREDTTQSARPSCGRSALAGAGEKQRGSLDASAAARLRQPRRVAVRARDMHAPARAVLR